jgi:hypothetical protein
VSNDAQSVLRFSGNSSIESLMQANRLMCKGSIFYSNIVCIHGFFLYPVQEIVNVTHKEVLTHISLCRCHIHWSSESEILNV